MRVKYEELLNRFQEILMGRGFTEDYAKTAAAVFAGNSLDGIYSHGVNRFPKIVEDIDIGAINPAAKPTCELAMGAIERWDGHRGFGPLNARLAM